MPPQPIEFSDFSSGWIPSDDAASGRKNGLLQMDNLELDKKGALSLIGGTQVLGSAYPNPIQEIYSNILNDTRHDYVSDNAGVIYRDGASIGTGGDTENTGFGNAFGQTLIASGNTRLKDTGSGTPKKLGLLAPGLNMGVFKKNFAIGMTPRFLVDATKIVNLTPPQTVASLTIVSCVPSAAEGVGGPYDAFTITCTTTIPASFFGAFGIGLVINGNSNDLYNNTQDNPWFVTTFQPSPTPTTLVIGVFIPLSAGALPGFGGTLSIAVQHNSQFNADPFGNLNEILAYGDTIVQTTQVKNAPIDLSTLTLYNPATTLGGTPTVPPDTYLNPADWPNAQITHSQSATDVLKLILDFANGPGNASNIISVTFDFLLIQPDDAGDTVSDYYRCVFSNDTNSNATQLLCTFARTDFQRIGIQPLDWSTVYGYRITVLTTGSLNSFQTSPVNLAPQEVTYPTYRMYFDTYKTTNSYTTPSGIVITVPTAFNTDTVGPHFENGLSSKTVINTALPTDTDNPIEWAGMYVNDNGKYVAKSEIGPATVYAVDGTVIPGSPNNKVSILLGYPLLINQSSADSQATHLWIFRRGGSLAQWYRTQVIPIAKNNNLFIDDLSDQDALTLGITVNLNLKTINSTISSFTPIRDKIIDIIGPIEGRWYYFTNNTMYPSDINNPDLVDVSLGVATTSASEDFLWAKKVADAAVLVGTYKEVYLLTGTFQTLPDNTVDIYYRGVGCKYPPIVHMASAGNGQVFYLASDGWRAIDTSGNNPLLTVPSTDQLYRGISSYGYSVNVQQVPGQMSFPCILARNKLWCSITGQGRIEVLDSVRSYWRSVNYGLGDCTALTATQDGNILAAFADKKLRYIDIQGTSTSGYVDGVTKQVVNILTPIFDGGSKRNRKELYTLKLKLNTGGDALTCKLINDLGSTYNLGSVSSSSLVDTFLDVPSSGLELSKWWQYQLTGSFKTLSISDISLTIEPRPEPVTFRRIFNQNFGNASKKRLRVWPFVIDTLGNVVNFKAKNDNADGATTSVTTTEKTTALIFYKTDVFAIDYGMEISCPNGGMFEFWDPLMPPDIVQTLPIARQFDQVGPEEFFRYGRVKQFEIRVQPFGGTVLPWTMYFNDNSIVNGSIAMLDSKEQSYFIGVPMKAAGTIIRMEFGPTSFNFHRFYVRIQVSKTGRDTEQEWITIPDPTEGE